MSASRLDKATYNIVLVVKHSVEHTPQCHVFTKFDTYLLDEIAFAIVRNKCRIICQALVS